MTKEQLGSLILDSERQLYSTAKTILFSDHDCADAIQETIVKAFSNVGTLKNDNYARTWLIRILINECYSLVRNPVNLSHWKIWLTDRNRNQKKQRITVNCIQP